MRNWHFYLLLIENESTTESRHGSFSAFELVIKTVAPIHSLYMALYGLFPGARGRMGIIMLVADFWFFEKSVSNIAEVATTEAASLPLER